MNAEVASSILSMLREARSLVYRDAESFSEAVAVLEHVGQILSGEVGNGLGAYEGAILALAGQAPGTSAREVRELFRTVREARNDSVHSGDFIRHHVLRLLELLLILEEALTVNSRVASDLMVRHPVTAELWHNIATVRRNMLTNSFSYIPVCVNGVWKLISDQAIVGYLRGSTGAERGRRLGATVESAIVSSNLELELAPLANAELTVEQLRQSICHVPILIVDSAGHLIGILTAFDLL